MSPRGEHFHYFMVTGILVEADRDVRGVRVLDYAGLPPILFQDEIED